MLAFAAQPSTTVTMAAVFDLEAPEPEVFDLDDGWGDDIDFGDASGTEAASVPVKVAEGIGTDEALTRRRPSEEQLKASEARSPALQVE